MFPNTLESAIIAGDVPRLRLIAMDAETLGNLGYSPEEIQQIQNGLQQNIHFAAHDDLSVAKRLFAFQNNKNHTAEYYYISAMQNGKKLVQAALGLVDIYAKEGRQGELHSIFERYLAATWAQRADNSGSVYISSLIQCGDYQKALSFWKANIEQLNIDAVVLLNILLEVGASDDEIQQHVSLPIKSAQLSGDIAAHVLLQMCNRSGSDIIDAYVTDVYNASFAFLRRDFFAKFKVALSNIKDISSHSEVGAGVSALINGFAESDQLMQWFREIVPRYANHELIDVARNIIIAYVDCKLVGYSDIGDVIRYIQNLGQNIPEDMLVYLRPQFTNIKEQNAWLDECIANTSEIDEMQFELFCQIAEESKDTYRLHNYLCSLAKSDLLFAHAAINKATGVLNEELASKSDSYRVNEMLNCISLLGKANLLSEETRKALVQGFLVTGRKAEAFMVRSALKDCTAQHCAALDGYSLFGVLSEVFASENLCDIDALIETWGKYFHITENDALRLSEIRDYYNAPEKWSDEAKESLAKHLLVSSATPLYWQLMCVAHSAADATVKVNVQFHRAVAENVSVSSVLENAICYNLDVYAIDTSS